MHDLFILQQEWDTDFALSLPPAPDSTLGVMWDGFTAQEVTDLDADNPYLVKAIQPYLKKVGDYPLSDITPGLLWRWRAPRDIQSRWLASWVRGITGRWVDITASWEESGYDYYNIALDAAIGLGQSEQELVGALLPGLDGSLDHSLVSPNWTKFH